MAQTLRFHRMRWLLVAGGGLWLVLAAAEALQMLLSPRHRRTARRFGIPPLLTLAVEVIAGVGNVVAGLLSPPSLLVAGGCLAPMLVLSVIQRRRLQDRGDLPPPVSRMLAVPVNPLTQLRHPIRTARAEWAAYGHPIRSRRELHDWEDPSA